MEKKSRIIGQKCPTLHPQRITFCLPATALMRFWPSRSLKVIHFCTSWKPIYDVFISNCLWPRSISPRFRDITHPSLIPSQGNLFEFHGNLLPVRWKLRHFPTYSENRVIVLSVVLSQYTRVTDIQTDRRQTTHHDRSRTLQCNCNVWLRMLSWSSL